MIGDCLRNIIAANVAEIAIVAQPLPVEVVIVGNHIPDLRLQKR